MQGLWRPRRGGWPRTLGALPTVPPLVSALHDGVAARPVSRGFMTRGRLGSQLVGEGDHT